MDYFYTKIYLSKTMIDIRTNIYIYTNEIKIHGEVRIPQDVVLRFPMITFVQGGGEGRG